MWAISKVFFSVKQLGFKGTVSFKTYDTTKVKYLTFIKYDKICVV